MVQTTPRWITPFLPLARRMVQYLSTLTIKTWLWLEMQKGRTQQQDRHAGVSRKGDKLYVVIFVAQGSTPLVQSFVIAKPSTQRLVPDQTIQRLFAIQYAKPGRQMHMIQHLTLEEALRTLQAYSNSKIIQVTNYDNI